MPAPTRASRTSCLTDSTPPISASVARRAAAGSMPARTFFSMAAST